MVRSLGGRDRPFSFIAPAEEDPWAEPEEDEAPVADDPGEEAPEAPGEG